MEAFKDILQFKAPLISSTDSLAPAAGGFQFQQKVFPKFLKDTQKAPRWGTWYFSGGLVQAPLPQERAYLKVEQTTKSCRRPISMPLRCTALFSSL